MILSAFVGRFGRVCWASDDRSAEIAGLDMDGFTGMDTAGLNIKG